MYRVNEIRGDIKAHKARSRFGVPVLLAALVVVLCWAEWSAAEPRPGRTDGAEGSEFGRGGYSRFGESGQIYAFGYFGAATVDIEPEDGTGNFSSTDLVSGFHVGYMTQDWLAVQLGFGHISGDRPADMFMVGVRNSMNREPINYFFSLDAELYSPDRGGSKFGIVPGVGAEILVTEWMQLGLSFQRDFIFADDSIGINRFAARLQFKF